MKISPHHFAHISGFKAEKNRRVYDVPCIMTNYLSLLTPFSPFD